MKTITINLCGPLQSYGYKDYNNTRKTKLEPTKSAIAGIIACCGGVKRNDPEIKNIENSIEIKINKYKVPKKIGEKIRKEEHQKILIDFQIARGTEENPIWQANGKIMNKNLVIKREYLMDTYFEVFISGEDSLIEQYEKWLKDPVWPPYLGRKSCIPSIPIYIEG